MLCLDNYAGQKTLGYGLIFYFEKPTPSTVFNLEHFKSYLKNKINNFKNTDLKAFLFYLNDLFCFKKPYLRFTNCADKLINLLAQQPT